jgi:hypothetical protein
MLPFFMGGGVALHERLRGGDGGNAIPLPDPFAGVTPTARCS